MSKRHCVVLAGGLGTRARDLTGGLIPKALLEVSGKPFLERKIHSLVQMGFGSATLLVGDLGDQIETFISRNDFNIDIEIISDGETLLGTAGSIRRSLDYLPNEFWVTFGDSLVNTNLGLAEKFAVERSCSRIMTVLHNKDQFQISNATVVDGIVKQYKKKSDRGTHEWIDYGLLLLKNQDFEKIAVNEVADLTTVIDSLIEAGEMCGYEVTERFWDVGDPTGFQQTLDYFNK